MIKKFGEFDAVGYHRTKKVNESNDLILDDEFSDKRAVHSDPIICKFAKLVFKHLNTLNIGKFGIYYNIIYSNGIPGVWFYGLDGNDLNIVCCRDVNRKIISVYTDGFEINATNRSAFTYSTEVLGFKDVLDQMSFDLKNKFEQDGNFVNEANITGVSGFNNMSDSKIENFKNNLTYDQRHDLYMIIKDMETGRRLNLSSAQTAFINKVNSDDSKCVELAQAYSKGGVSAGSMQAMITIAYNLVHNVTADSRALDALERNGGLLSEYKNDFEEEISKMKVETGKSAEDTDEPEDADVVREREEEKKRKLAEDTREYNETMAEIGNVVDKMCKYIKNNKILDANDRSVMLRRLLIITGINGAGKSHSVYQSLKKNGMKRNRDYFEVSSGSVASSELYKHFYNYNGKMIIFDDSSSQLFMSDKNISLWKIAFDDNNNNLRYPLTTGSNSDTIYNASRCTRQERYFKEIGKKSNSDFAEFKRKRTNELKLQKGSDGNGLSEVEIDDKIKKEWAVVEQDTKPLYPNEFKYDGIIVVICNIPRSALVKDLGEHWMAISNRSISFDIHPSIFIVWESMKNTILNDANDDTIPDEMRFIPKSYVDEFIDEVEKLLPDPRYQNLTWRLLYDFRLIFGGEEGKRNWKHTLKQKLSMK